MTQPIRPIVIAATDLPKPVAEYTLRDAVDWWKSIAENTEIGFPNELEQKSLNTTFLGILKAIEDREGISSGYLGWFLSEVAQAELKLLETATDESQAAMSYGQEE